MALNVSRFALRSLLRSAAPSVTSRNSRALFQSAATKINQQSRSISTSNKWMKSVPVGQAAKKLYTSEEPMFCFQCEQTRDVKGCTTVGVCGKTPDVAALQDLLVYADKGISMYAKKLREMNIKDHEIDIFILKSLFATLTNVNFDADRFVQYLNSAEKLLNKARTMYEEACMKQGKVPERLSGPAQFKLADKTDVEKMTEQGNEVGIKPRQVKYGNDVVGLQELITYGLKGAAAYAEHAEILGKESDVIYTMVHDVLDFLARENATVEEYLGMAMKVGELNLKIMEILDAGATEQFGHPTPTRVPIHAVKGKCILVSGHDLKDLEMILKQTEGTGINVYTHGELLPGHGYPGLKKYKHLVGNYGGAWQLQKLEFSAFPGPIVVTTNCIIEPKKGYKDRIFTRNVVGWPGVKHIQGNDFSEVIKIAKDMKGFEQDEKPKYVTVGFGRNAVLGVADKVVEAVKSGAIKHFFLIGGCDGAEGERNYFKDMALNAPKDTVILTLACGKYRFNKYDFGDIGGIPRLLDVGQCNDAYSAIQIASGLAKAFNTDVNGLPLSFIVSWFEQKAVAVLLTLLHLGIKNIHLGPHLPAFCTPTMLSILQEKFQLRGIGTAAVDMERMLKGNN
jgi:hydroxylamine reductase